MLTINLSIMEIVMMMLVHGLGLGLASSFPQTQ